MITLTTTTNTSKPTSLIKQMSQFYNEEQNPTAVFPNHYNNLHNFLSSSKHIAFTDDDSLNNEENDNDYSQFDHLKAIWPQIINKRYANKAIRGEGRLWAIPYRFGKRAVMPYRFGKRAGMHFQFGKQSASL